MSLVRKFLGAALAAMLVVSTTCASLGSYEKNRSHDATVALFRMHKGERVFNCSGESIKSPSKDYAWILTAKHCVVDIDTNEINQDADGSPEQVTFADDEASSAFYPATIVAISADEDFALLRIDVKNAPYVELGDETKLRPADKIFDWSYPHGVGKVYTEGKFIAPKFPHTPVDLVKDYPIWKNAMPADILIGGGSSGSAVLDPKQKKQIGVLVGSYSDGMRIVEPISRAKDMLAHLDKNTPDQWRQNNPIKEVEYFFF